MREKESEERERYIGKKEGGGQEEPERGVSGRMRGKRGREVFQGGETGGMGGKREEEEYSRVK